MVKISVYTCGNDHFKDEWYLLEGIRSALGFADEVVVVYGGNPILQSEFIAPIPESDLFRKGHASFCYHANDDGTFLALLKFAKENNKIKLFMNPWEKRMRKHQTALQKSIALSHCTGDVCVLFDSDEVFHEDDYKIIRNLAEVLIAQTNIKAVYFDTIHFWRDFNHVKMGEGWYTGKVYMVKNDEGIFHGKHPSMDSIEPDAHVGFGHTVLTAQETYLPKHPPTVCHYGHVRSKEAYIRKKNAIERRYHGFLWENLTPDTWDWDMSDTVEFTGKHPKVMEDRINEFTAGH